MRVVFYEAMGEWLVRVGLGAATAVMLAGCPSSSSVFSCGSDSDCTGSGNGTCQSNGFCAFPDAMCESGMRYGDLAGGGFANMCVPMDEGGSTSSLGGSGSVTATTDVTTTLTPGDSSGDTSGSAPGTSDTTEDDSGTTTGVSQSCEVFFDDDFGDDLPRHWSVVGSGSVLIGGGNLDFVLSRSEPNSPIVIRHTSVVTFDGVWLMARLAGLPTQDGIEAILSLERDASQEAYGLLVDTSTQELVAGYSSGSGGFAPLATTAYGPGMSWLRIRESGGGLLFEVGSDENDLTVFHEEDADIRDWVGTLAIGADNEVAVSDETVVTYDDAVGCAQPTR